MSSTSGFVGSFIGTPHAGGGVGGIDSPGAPTAIADFNPEVVQALNVNNFAKQNATPTILATTPIAPADSNNHLVLITTTTDITTSETGGAVTATITQPNGHAQTVTLAAGTIAGPAISSTIFGLVVPGGSTISILQSSALTAGSSTVSVRVAFA